MEDWIRKHEQLIRKAEELDVWRFGLDGRQPKEKKKTNIAFQVLAFKLRQRKICFCVTSIPTFNSYSSLI